MSQQLSVPCLWNTSMAKSCLVCQTQRPAWHLMQLSKACVRLLRRQQRSHLLPRNAWLEILGKDILCNATGTPARLAGIGAQSSKGTLWTSAALQKIWIISRRCS